LPTQNRQTSVENLLKDFGMGPGHHWAHLWLCHCDAAAADNDNYNDDDDDDDDDHDNNDNDSF